MNLRNFCKSLLEFTDRAIAVTAYDISPTWFIYAILSCRHNVARMKVPVNELAMTYIDATPCRGC